MQQRLPTQVGSVLVQKSGHVDDDVQISALDAFYGTDGRKLRYIGEVLDWYRREDAGDLKRSELNELVENLTCLNAFKGKIWKSNQKVVTDEKSWKTWKSNLNSVTNEELVQNGVMNPINLFTSRSQHKIFGQIPTVDTIPEYYSSFSRCDHTQEGFLVLGLQFPQLHSTDHSL